MRPSGSRGRRCVVILACLALVACSASQRHTALSTTTASLDAAQVGFVAYDGEHQLALVAACPLAEGKLPCQERLIIYRADRAKVLAAMIGAYKAVAAAWRLDTGPSVATAIAAGVAVEQAIKGMGAL